MITSQDRAELIEKLASIGIPRDTIEFESDPRFGPSGTTISVEVELHELPEIGNDIEAAVENVLRRVERSGVRFSLAEETCDGALALARREAIRQAERSAADLADALGVILGSVTGAVEFPSSSFGPPISDGCGIGQFRDPYALSPFDAEPQIDVSVQLQITYSID